MWLVLGIAVATCLVLMAVWLIWSLIRSAATDSSSVSEEYEEYVKQRAESSSPDCQAEKHPGRRLT